MPNERDWHELVALVSVLERSTASNSARMSALEHSHAALCDRIELPLAELLHRKVTKDNRWYRRA